MWLTAIGIFVFNILKAVCPGNATNDATYRQEETDQQRLVKALFENYDKSLRPVAKTKDVTNVTVNPALFDILNTDEAAETITIVQSHRMNWNDVFMRWNPNDYDGMEQLLIPASRMWYPDITVLSVIDVVQPIPDDKNYVIIAFDGTVLITINQVLTMKCRYYIIMFPFDIQNCTMQVSSWMHTADQMDVFFTTPTDLHNFNENAEWDLVSMMARRGKTHYGASATAWTIVSYDIVIERKPIYYLLTFVLPCFMITTISIIGIFSPFNDSGDREEKVTMGLTTLLTMSVILTLVADKMPKSSQGMPLLAIYIMLQIATAAVASLMAVIIIYKQLKWTTGNSVPSWLLTVTRLTRKKDERSAHETIAAISSHSYKAEEIANLGMSPSTNALNQQFTILNNIQIMLRQVSEYLRTHIDEENLRKDWQRVCQRLDLLLMLLFLLLNSILTVGFLIIGYTNRHLQTS